MVCSPVQLLQARLTAADMSAFASFESSLNSQYSSGIVTEWPFNGLGVLDAVSVL